MKLRFCFKLVVVFKMWILRVKYGFGLFFKIVKGDCENLLLVVVEVVDIFSFEMKIGRFD